MIPVLYPSSTNTDFTKNGYGFLKDCISCEITEELNGIYESVFTYPINGLHYSEIEPDMIVKMKASEKSGNQLFRIYRITKSIKNTAKIYCQHISYDLCLNVVSPFGLSNVGVSAALQGVLDTAYYQHPFTHWTDKTTVGKINIKVPSNARMCLLGMEGSVLDGFGGEYEFDNFVVKLHNARGTDSGVTIYYGKNMTDFSIDTNLQNTYTAVYPYAVRDNQITRLTERVIETSTFSNYSEPRAMPLDLSDKFDEEEEITETKLRQLAQTYITNNKIDDVLQDIKVSFIDLSQTEEYKDIAPLEQCGLGDTVTVRYFNLGLSVKSKVVKTVYDCLKEQYTKIELGKSRIV